MCSILKFKNCMGRNFDYEISLKEKPYHYTNDKGNDMIGMVTGLVNEYPLFYDAMNEQGLCMGGLAFDGNASYKYYSNTIETTYDKWGAKIFYPYNLILKVLSDCKTVDDAKEYLKDGIMMDKPFNGNMQNTDMHWFICDKEQSIVVETVNGFIHYYNNPFDIMTNNPPFNELLRYNSRGTVTKGLCGDYTSQGRFQRLSYLKDCCEGKELPCNDITQTFHLLGGVEQSYGATPVHSKYEYTIYSVVYDMVLKTLYVRYYDGRRNTIGFK